MCQFHYFHVQYYKNNKWAQIYDNIFLQDGTKITLYYFDFQNQGLPITITDWSKKTCDFQYCIC